MDEKREQILSFPSPVDIRAGSRINAPILLEQGFLLDQRGIHPNSAFLTTTFEEYGKLTSTPTNEELMALVSDTDPFVIMYRCNIKREDDLVLKLNELIRNNNFDNCIRLK